MLRVVTGIGVAVAALSAAAADPRFEVLPHGAVDLSADGCVVLGTQARRQENGITTSLLPGVYDASGIALAPDAKAALVAYHGGGSGLLRAGGPALGIPVPRTLRDLSDGGHSVVGDLGAGPILPFHWRDGTLAELPVIPGPAPGGSAAAVAADGSAAAGWSTAENGRPEAVVWGDGASAPLRLGVLPGHEESEVVALSADGLVAVGTSRSAGGARAFRWDGAALLDLGPLSERAEAVSADGAIVTGTGPEGAFSWDAAHGTRQLADALLEDHALDVGGFRLDRAFVSLNGRAFVGEGRDPEGASRAWRIRLDAARCPAGPPVDLALHQGASALLERPTGLVVDSQRRVFVSGFDSQNVVRLDASFADFPPPPAVEALDPTDDGPPDQPLMLGVGPDDGVYVGLYARSQLWKLAPDGTRSLVFDGSGYAPIPSDDYGPIPTSPVGVAVAPDGTLFVATWARLLRIDANGSAHELLDVLEVAPGGFVSPFFGVALQPGRVVLHDGGRLFVLSAESGAVLEVVDATQHGVDSIARIASDDEGGVWIGGASGGLAYLGADGAMRTAFTWWEADEASSGLPGLSRIRPVAGDDGTVFYSGDGAVVQRRGDGSLLRLLDGSTSDVFFRAIPGVQALAYADGVLYWVDDASGQVGRTEVPAPDPPACRNGQDDDGDGAADFPADPGCFARDDDWEGSRRFTCDNGFDDDGDGAADYPADGACAAPRWTTEATACDDGIDNDGDGAFDWDGAGQGLADPECGGDPLRVVEQPWYCGLGFEVALVALPLASAARRWRRRARSTSEAGLIL